MAAPTVADFLVDALEEIGAAAAAEITTADQTKALAVMKRMVDTQNSDTANLFTVKIDTWAMVSGTQSYTIGVDPSGVLTATYAAVRPVKLLAANLFLSGTGTSAIRQKIDILDSQGWRAKTYQGASGPPREMYNDGGNPLSRYYFYSIPDAAYTFETHTLQQFGINPALADTMIIPPGYYEYWLYGTALRLCAPFGVDPKQTTLGFYREAKASVRKLNKRTPRIRTNGDLIAGHGSAYNWATGTEE